MAIALPILILLLIEGPIEWALRYQSWSHLSKQKLIDSSNWYIANRAPGNDACIYAVECKGGRASLKLIKSIKDWDLEASKQIAWDRKFNGVCEGQTANFALQLAADNPQFERPFDGYNRAVWSFYNDRFIPSRTRFGSAAFSETEAEPCLTQFAVTKRLGSAK